MSDQDLFVFVIGGVVTAIAFWGLVAAGVLAFRRWQVDQELDDRDELTRASDPPEWLASEEVTR